jgi:hypothetical protein
MGELRSWEPRKRVWEVRTLELGNLRTLELRNLGTIELRNLGTWKFGTQEA